MYKETLFEDVRQLERFVTRSSFGSPKQKIVIICSKGDAGSDACQATLLWLRAREIKKDVSQVSIASNLSSLQLPELTLSSEVNFSDRMSQVSNTPCWTMNLPGLLVHQFFRHSLLIITQESEKVASECYVA